ncbi:transcription factor bHLH126-like [Actinidia eriantha]|uniref:transcription factor bHLH126-like n=2 Tax=Actinidia eriantha TaxID=165200 RepID=UPI002586852C|nr:transcription factor bHLH126-like [Actinidia eriantha]
MLMVCDQGRRSVSDHIHESVNYIKHLEKKIKELGMKREKLKKMTNSSDPRETKESSCSCFSNSVKVSSCHDGVEILISSGFSDEGFALSRVLEALIEEGIDVVSYFSALVNDRLLHTIKSEVIDPTCVDMRKLQEKLTEVINKKLG